MSLHGAYIGAGNYKTKDDKGNTIKAYSVWCNMLTRCYNEKYHSSATYMGKGVTVCDEWLDYQNFAAWFFQNYRENYELDKDIMGGNIYSPNNCRLIPKSLNSALIQSRCVRNGLPAGVSFNKGKRKYEVYIRKSELFGKGYRKYVGAFADIDEAATAYKKEKTAYLKQLADHFYDKGMIALDVRDALYSYKI